MIHIDTRIGSRHLVAPLELRGLPVTQDTMEFGDIAFGGHDADGDTSVGIELKKLDDLINSLTTKRFQAHQLPGMLRTYPWPILIIEGLYRESSDGLIEKGVLFGPRLNWMRHRSSMTYQRLEGTLYTLTFATGVSVLKTRDHDHTVAEIARLYHWWSKPWEAHQSHKVSQKSAPALNQKAILDPWFNRDRYFPELVAMQIPSLGTKRAIAAARHFRSARRMTWASTKAWEEVPGVGKVLAQRAAEICRKEF